MPAVLVHGVPETSALWDGLEPLLGRDDVVTLQLPGFGCPRPDGFGATKEEYVDWLIGELEKLDGPIDLLGHDWGGGFVVRLVSTRADLVRSWITDAAGLGDIEFEWHDFAKIWQTPEEGEKFWSDQLASPVEERAGTLVLEVTDPDASIVVEVGTPAGGDGVRGTVHVHDGAAPIGAPMLRGDAVEVLEMLSIRRPFANVPDDARWLIEGLAEVFEAAP